MNEAFVAQGKYIVIDGLDGSGKGTQIALLKQKMLEILFVREPGGTDFGEEMRSLLNRHTLTPEGNFFAMLAIRAEVRSKVVKGALREGKSVISDRSDSSTYAYQIFGEQARDLENVFWTLRYNLQPLPDVYIFLDIDPELAVERLDKAKGKETRVDATLSRFDEEVVDFHARVQAGFKRFAEMAEGSIFYFVDASKSEEEVHQELVKVLSKHIPF